MAVHFTNLDRTKTTANTPVFALAANDTLFVGPDAVLATTGSNSPVISGPAGVTVHLAGDLFAGASVGIRLGQTADVRIDAEGSIGAAESGMVLSGSNQEVTNAGTVLAGDTGIAFTRAGQVTNSGLVSGTVGISAGEGLVMLNTGTVQSVGTLSAGGFFVGYAVSADGDASIVNSGSIVATMGYAIQAGAADGTVDIVNTGLIASNRGFAAISTWAGGDTVANSGTIRGRVSLGAGDDLYDGTRGVLHGGLSGGSGADTLLGGVGGESIDGGAGDDEITAGAGDDTVIGGAGADQLDGGEGRDLLSYAGSTSAVLIDLAAGELAGGDAEGDEVVGFEAYAGSSLADTLLGSTQRDLLQGGAGNDSVYGHAGNDRLFGQAGADTLQGSAGADFMRGGAGADLFRYNGVGDSTPTSAGRDRILDFNLAEGDRIDLSAIDADATSPGNQTFGFIGGAAFGNVAGQLRFQQQGGSTLVQADTNGDGVAEMQIQLLGLLTPVAGSFVL